MKTTEQIKEALRLADYSVRTYESTVRHFKGLKCEQTEKMIAADREKMVEDLGFLHSLLTSLVMPQPVNMVQMAEINCLSLNTSL